MKYYAVFAGDEHYHLMRPKSTTYTLCGLPTLKRGRGVDEYRPPARMLPERPPSALYRLCPGCAAADNSAKLGGAGREEEGGAGG